jgi:hypothetical protein
MKSALPSKTFKTAVYYSGNGANGGVGNNIYHCSSGNICVYNTTEHKCEGKLNCKNSGVYATNTTKMCASGTANSIEIPCLAGNIKKKLCCRTAKQIKPKTPVAPLNANQKRTCAY